mmetsp:Transcript_16999/g.27108  ORF Transcript_16999/g.27108 Transcript_16999/m.27108 type:complete len:232 (+) Transcript_16999:635-1330(+)
MEHKRFRLRPVEKMRKLIVEGYMRRAQRLLPTYSVFYNIPDLVSHICALYFLMNDRFDEDTLGVRMRLNPNTQCITQAFKGSNSAFLSNIVSSGFHMWRFKIVQCRRGGKSSQWSATVGLWKVRKEDSDCDNLPLNTYFTNVAASARSKSYAYAFGMGVLIDARSGNPWSGREYGTKAKTGDVIEMYCDLDKRHIGFSVNGIDYGIAFENVSAPLRAVINLHDAQDSVQLL